MKYFSILLAVSLIFSFISIGGCGSKPDRSLIGKWETLAEVRFPKVTLEFLKDGTLIRSSGSISNSANYRVIDKDRLEVDPGSDWGQRFIYNIIISNNELIFTNPNTMLFVDIKMNKEQTAALPVKLKKLK